MQFSLKQIKQVNWLHLFVLVTFVALVMIRQQSAGRQRSDEHREALPLSAVRQLFPGASRLEPQPEQNASAVFDADDERIGTVIDTTPYSGLYPGYAGPVPCLVGLSPSEEIVGVRPFNHNESMSFIDYVAEEGLFSRWDGMTPGAALGKGVDTITGATMTCDAITRSVQHALSHYVHATAVADQSPKSFPWRATALGVILIFGLLHAAFPRKLRPLRPIFLLLNIVVIGFIVGNMISLALLHGWIANGLPWPQAALLILMGLGAFLLPLLSGRNVYCLYICPYGSAQELAGKCWRWRRPRLPKAFIKLLQIARGGLLAAALLTALYFASPDFAAWEPFAAFRWRSAPTLAIAIAGVFLLISFVMPRLWCRTLCPTGYLIDLCRRGRRKTAEESNSSLFTFERGALITACLATILLALKPSLEKRDEEEPTESENGNAATSIIQETQQIPSGEDSRRRRRRGRW